MKERHCMNIDRSCSVMFMDDYPKFIAAVKSLILRDRNVVHQSSQMTIPIC